MAENEESQGSAAPPPESQAEGHTPDPTANESQTKEQKVAGTPAAAQTESQTRVQKSASTPAAASTENQTKMHKSASTAAAVLTESQTKIQKAPAPVVSSPSKSKTDKLNTTSTSLSRTNIPSIANVRGKSETMSKVKVQPTMVTSTPKKERESSLTGISRAISGRLGSEIIEPSFKKSVSRSRMAVGSIISIRKSSVYGEIYGERGRAARFMNSYKLNSDNPFNVEKVEKILEAVMIETLEDLTYDSDKCSKLAKKASAVIRTKLKELEFDRYKLVCIVTIGEKQSQDVFVTCRFLWDTDRDRYAKYVHENMHVFGIALCFGIYYE